MLNHLFDLWHWPQYVMATIYAISALHSLNKYHDNVVAFLLTLSVTGGVIYTMHAGGFW